jgi:FtsP/CotA-like multicopper oxidase with cupredoxin domain
MWMGCSSGHDDHAGAHARLPPALPLLKPDAHQGLAAAPRAQDLDPDPRVLKLELRAMVSELEYLPGKRTTAWTYNGAVPGPLLEARRGDRIVVDFRNELPEDTTIHWHGLRVPNAMDGAGHLTHPIPPGGSFEYSFVVSDAGTFWYHPHVRSDTQVEKGLYGALVVRDELDDLIRAEREEVIVLDDVRVDPATGLLDLTKDDRAAMMGREGNLVILNGRPSNASITVRAGERVRLRLVNAANARYFRLALTGGSLTQVGGDGGLLAAPRPVTEGLLLVPGERADLVAEVATPGATAVLKALAYERALGAGATEEVDVLRLVAGPDEALRPLALTARLREVLPLDQAGAVTRTIRLNERMAHGQWQFTINDSVFPQVPGISGEQGTRQRWAVENRSDMDHPFHLHGFFFQVAGEAPEWKDTVNIPARKTVELIVDLAPREGAAGPWMYHCHILEHAEGGMAGELIVR